MANDDTSLPNPGPSPEPSTDTGYGRLYSAATPGPMQTPPGNWEPPLPDEVSAMLPGYEVTGVLGRGGMGAVYRGIQSSLDRPVAIKLLPPELGIDPEFEARFRREAKSMARLNHPNIVQIYDFGVTEGGHHYFVMEFVDGTDLHRMIRSGGLEPEGALNAVSQICDALEYAHAEGFVHRDIKPANIFINHKGVLKVGDFGLAKLVEGTEDAVSATEKMGLTMTGVAMGTPHYIAPEQLAAESTVDRRADIYSLGVMFYEMLTGEIPRGAVKPPSQKVKALDVRLDDVVFRAMETDPAERYQSATDLRTDVDGIRLKPMEEMPSSESVVTGSRPISSAVPRRERAARDHRVLLWSGIAVALLLAVGVGIWQAVSGDGDGGEAIVENNDSPAPAVGPLVFPVQPGDPGRLEAMGASVTSGFLKSSEPYTDFVQVCASSTASGEAVIWAALRQNGEVIFSQGDAHRPTTPARNVAMIRSDRGSGFFLIHRDGSLTVTGEAAPPPAGLPPVVDAVGGGERIALALHADRTVSVWGKSHREWPVPAEALREVVSLSASRYGAMTVTADGALHRWGRDYSYRRIEPPTGDPFVEVMGAWTVPQEGKVRSSSGKLFSMEGVPAVIAEIAVDLAYGGPVFYRDRQGFWCPMADGGAGFLGLPEFSEGHEVAAFVSAKKSAAMLRIVPVGEDLPTLKSLDQWLETEHEYEPLNDDSEENFRISKDRIVYLNDDGSEKTPYLLTITGARSAEFAYTTGRKVPISFSEDFSRVQRLATKTTNYALKVDGVQLGDTGDSATARVTGRGGILRGIYYDQDTGKVVPLPIPDDWMDKPVVKVGSHNYGAVRWWAIAEDGEVLRFDGGKRITGELEERIVATAFDWERLEAWVKPDGSLGAASRLQPVPAGNDFVDVKVGNAFALGLRKSGEVAIWFEKAAPSDRFVPGPDLIRDAVAIEASDWKGAILKKSGDLVWWDVKEGMQPTSIPAGTTVTALSGNHDSVLVLTSDGSYQHPNSKPITGKGAATAIHAGHGLSGFRTKQGTWAFRDVSGTNKATGVAISEAIKAHQAEIDASIDLAFSADGSKNRGVVLWIEPLDTKAGLTSSTASQPLLDRIAGKKYYRATNAANWLTFGPELGKMVLRNLDEKDISYEYKAISENEIEWRWENGDRALGRFEQGFDRLVYPDGTIFSTMPGPIFATDAEEIAYYAGGSEWQVESESKPFLIRFNDTATGFSTQSGTEFPLTSSGQPFRKLFRWENSDEDNWMMFRQTYESGFFFDAKAKGEAVTMKKVAAVPKPPDTDTAAPLPSGRLHAFGFYFDDDKLVPVAQPDDRSDYVACSSESGPWQAVRANGDLVVGNERNRPDPPITGIPPEGLIGSQQTALDRNGRLLTWGDNMRNRVGELDGVELFDAEYRFAAAKFRNGDIRIWNILPEESPETYQPPREELGDVVKIVAANCGVTFLRRDGTILFCNQSGIRKTPFDRDRFADVDNVINGFIGLTVGGEVKGWGDKDRVEARDGLPRITAIRGAGRMVAAMEEDGTWTSWTTDDAAEGAKAVQEKLGTIRGAIDLDAYADKQVARLVWIEPEESGKSTSGGKLSTGETPVSAPIAPADPITQRIASIDDSYRERYEAEVAKPHSEAVSKLDGQISAALKREQDAASQAGELDAVLQWKRAIDRLGSGQGVPTIAEIAAENPPVVRPEKLLGFYTTYRDLLGKLEVARDEKEKPVRVARDQALDQYQRELTQTGDIDGALRVKAARAEVPGNTPAPEAKAEPKPAALMTNGSGGSLLLANRKRYQIDYSRSGTLKVAGTIGNLEQEQPILQPTAEESQDVCFVAARYESWGGWMAVKKNGEVISSISGKSKVPENVKKPRWLDIGTQAIAVNQDGTVTIWGEQDWKPKQALKGVIKAESGHENSIALHEDGTVSVWGPMYDSYWPDAEWLKDVVDVGAGSVRAFVLKSDGRVIGWNAEGDLSKQDFNSSPKLRGDYETSFGNLKNLVAISGNHRGVVGLDAGGRWVNHDHTITPVEGLLTRVTSGYMLATGLSRNGRIFLENLEQDQRRFPAVVEAALSARNVISVAGGGDGTEPKFWGFIAWVESNELAQVEPGGLILLGYRQYSEGSREEDFPQMELKPKEKVIAVAARNRHGGAFAAWTNQ
ncbi:MAG: serine/threonine protein kinase [Verrucomicrobiae bacterium]|nr:serine/threonine protein kinase [Verrucomicrobiae bacterium]